MIYKERLSNFQAEIILNTVGKCIALNKKR